MNKENLNCIEVLAPFAYVKEYIDGGDKLPIDGRLLIICGEEYKAWNYDYYIFHAIDLVKKWKPHQITYDRIVHLRYWLRENIQHCHNRCFCHLKSMRAVKLFIDELIYAEYPDDRQDEIDYELKTNAEIFSRSENTPDTLITCCDETSIDKKLIIEHIKKLSDITDPDTTRIK